MRRATNAIGALAGSFLFGLAMMAACSNADNLRTSGQPDNLPTKPNP